MVGNRLKDYYLYIFGFLLISTLMLTSCSRFQSSNLVKNKDSLEEDTFVASKKKEIISPIEVDKGEFFMAFDWINNQTICYVTNVDGGSNVYFYNIFTGENKLVYESEFPIATVLVSPSKEKLLIRSTSTIDMVKIDIINNDGNILFTKEIEAYDVTFCWNYFDEDKVLVSTFSKEWQEQIYELAIEKELLVEINLTNPFSFWINKNMVLYLDWEKNNNSLFAPLVLQSVLTGHREEKLNDVYHFAVFDDIITTISVDRNSEKEAIYTFYNKSYERIHSTRIPLLTRFNDWLVPYYDMTDSYFITFKPKVSGDTNAYDEGFELISYDINHNQTKLLYDQLENEPLSCSPNGKLCLYGNYLEKVLNISKKKIVYLQKQESTED